MIGRYRIFNCSTESLLAHASAASRLKFITSELIISTARNKTGVNGWTAASPSGKSLEIFVQFWLRWGPTGQAVLLPRTPLQPYYLDIRLLSLESSLPDALNFS
ncbi:hypothetical protein T01_14105 [Trichinella spiralis]|uniref:Uncharacterized protein n=1 Tax=Trichinella spiralis TaxID=6334 RepID=A0A0V1AWU2_TRISP|nr:hypothetical protein T01_14105 [Trichinella spiralis]